MGEALLFASKAGADPAKVRQALMGGFASSKILEVHGERMIKRTFDPGFRIELHQKDLNLALAGARQLGISRGTRAPCGTRPVVGWFFCTLAPPGPPVPAEKPPMLMAP